MAAHKAALSLLQEWCTPERVDFLPYQVGNLIGKGANCSVYEALPACICGCGCVDAEHCEGAYACESDGCEGSCSNPCDKQRLHPRNTLKKERARTKWRPGQRVVKHISLEHFRVWGVVTNYVQPRAGRGVIVKSQDKVAYFCTKGEAEDSLKATPEARMSLFVVRVRAEIGSGAEQDGKASLLLPEYANEAFMGQFLTAKLLDTETCPHFVRYHSVHRTRKDWWVEQERISNNMDNVIDSLSAKQLLHYIVQIFAALQVSQAHLQLKHHDLHRGNVFLESRKHFEWRGKEGKAVKTLLYVLTAGDNSKASPPLFLAVPAEDYIVKIGDYGCMSMTVVSSDHSAKRPTPIRVGRMDFETLKTEEDSRWGKWDNEYEGKESYDLQMILSSMDHSRGPSAEVAREKKELCQTLQLDLGGKCSSYGRPLRSVPGMDAFALLATSPTLAQFRVTEEDFLGLARRADAMLMVGPLALCTK